MKKREINNYIHVENIVGKVVPNVNEKVKNKDILDLTENVRYPFTYQQTIYTSINEKPVTTVGVKLFNIMPIRIRNTKNVTSEKFENVFDILKIPDIYIFLLN